MRFKKSLLSAFSLGIFLPAIVLAAMSSTDYYIYADSLDLGGGLGTSTNFDLQGSIGGEVAPGISTSTGYQVNAGFQAMENGNLSLDLSSDNINLGDLISVGVVVSSSLNATVGTDSVTGYNLSIGNISGSVLTDVSDGAVDGTGGTQEYGLAVSGSHGAYLNDAAVVNSLSLASFNSAVSSDVTTLIFKAVRGGSSPVANYSQNITLTVAANP